MLDKGIETTCSLGYFNYINLATMSTINLEYTPNGYEKWEDIIYEFLLFHIKEKNQQIFPKVWGMMYGKGIIDKNEKEDFEYEQKYFLPFVIAYDKALRRVCKKYNINFRDMFILSFIS